MPAKHAAIDRFRRRLVALVFVDGLLRALLALGVLAVVVVLVGRGFGLPIVPAWNWLWATPLALVFAAARARRLPLSASALAVHLDRRLGLHGLLLAQHDGAELDPAFAQRLDAALAGIPQALPSLQWRRILWRPCVVSLLVALVATLPALDVPVPPPPVAATAALQQLERQLQELVEPGTLPPEVQQELQQRLQELAARVATGDADVWRELDDAGRRLARERDAVRPPAPAGDGGAAAATASAAADLLRQVPVADLARAAELLQRSGAWSELRQEAQRRLAAAAGPGGTFDAGKLPIDADQLAELARAIADRGLLADAARLAGALSPEQVAELTRMAQGFARAVGAFDRARELPQRFGGGRGAGQGGDGANAPAGAGAPARGPGAAALVLTADTDGVAAAPLELPATELRPDDWFASDLRRDAPDVAPQPNQAAGGAGVAGRGGASWQLQVMPRHRGVVRRYFDGARGETGDKR